MDFIANFTEKMREQAPAYEVRGLLTYSDVLYPLGTDTKVLSTVFELLTRPLIQEVAADNGLLVREPSYQNYYPDFTLLRGRDDPQKIAVDIKTTYRNFRADNTWTASFTLGSYTSFLRNPNKNILFPYADYARHYIIGFIYTRQFSGSSAPCPIGERSNAASPFGNVEWFVQEKYRISGEKPGSGNTANIGSIVGASVQDFASGNGPFAELGEPVFTDYWRNYGRTKESRPYTNLPEYWQWKAGQGQ